MVHEFTQKANKRPFRFEPMLRAVKMKFLVSGYRALRSYQAANLDPGATYIRYIWIDYGTLPRAHKSWEDRVE